MQGRILAHSIAAGSHNFKQLMMTWTAHSHNSIVSF